MQFYVHRAGRNAGPFSLTDLPALLAAGELRPDDLGWHAGLAGWRALSALAVAGAPPAPPTVFAITRPRRDPAGIAARVPSLEEVVRGEILPYEVNLRSLSVLYFLGVAFWAVVTIGVAIAESHHGALVLLAALPAALAAFFYWLARSMRRLRRRAVLPATIVAVLGLFVFPLGTFVNVLILALLHSRKGRFVFTPAYRRIMEDTPHAVHRVNRREIALIVLIVAVVLGLIVWTLFTHLLRRL